MVPSELMNSTKNEWGSGQPGLGVNSVSLGKEFFFLGTHV